MKVNQHFEKIKISLLIIFFISCLSSTAEDYDFSVENEDGKMIYYYVIDASEGTCGVMYESHWDFMYKKVAIAAILLYPKRYHTKAKVLLLLKLVGKHFTMEILILLQFQKA